MDMQTNTCQCSHHKIIPVLVILFGLTFLAGAMGWISAQAVSITWPILIILGGIAKLVGRSCKCRSMHQMPPKM